MLASGRDIIEADDNTFEISDFTVVTHLEGLIASLESIFVNIKETWLVNKDADDGVNDGETKFLKRKKEGRHLYYKGHEFMLNYYYDCRELPSSKEDDNEKEMDIPYVCSAAREMTASDRDFCECSSIARQFGVSSYIKIWPSDYLIDENQLHTILSAIEVATFNAEFELPVFLSFGDPSSDLYFGVCKNNNASTSYDSARLRRPPVQCKFYNDICAMFCEKACVDSLPFHARASVKFDFVHRKASPSPSVVAERDNRGLDFENEDNNADSDGEDREFRLADNNKALSTETPINIEYPFGADFDPFSELKLSACWMNVSANMIRESRNHIDMEPLSAPKWFVSVSFHDDSRYLLSSTITSLLDCREGLCSSCTLSSFAKDWLTNTSSTAANALNTIAHNFSANQLKFVSSNRNEDEIQSTKTPLTYAKRCLTACMKLAKEPRLEQNLEKSQDDVFSILKKTANESLSHVKAAPTDSLTSYLAKALVAALLRDSDSELSTLSVLWLKIIGYLRNSWDNCTSLSSVFVGENRQLDLSQCLLHQKLQMMEVCIRTKSQRHAKLNLMCSEKSQTADGIFEDDDGDSFYDANESFQFSSATKPLGRSHPLNENTFLVNYPNDRLLYVPFTQDFGPMTEDVVEKHSSYLTSLSADNGERVRAQLDILLSDMQAFKAANPGSILEDFVRWHSPRDFDPDGNNGKGSLSDRMCQENSVWVETWNNARPIPVTQQSRLFNETKEAETILQDFERITVAELIDLLLPVVTLDCVIMLVDKCAPCSSLVKDRILSLCNMVKRCSKTFTLDNFYDIKNEIEAIEVLISRYSSLYSLFSENKPDVSDPESLEKQLNDFIIELLATNKSGANVLRQLKSNRVKVLDAPLGTLAETIYNCFKKDVEMEQTSPYKISHPVRKQYILRLTTSRPNSNSRKVPQRMYVSVTESPESDNSSTDYHVSGSFTSDVIFK